jgi:hypothetical protein
MNFSLKVCHPEERMDQITRFSKISDLRRVGAKELPFFVNQGSKKYF